MTKPNEMTAEELAQFREFLHGHFVLGETKVVFEKMNGETRTLRGTLNMDEIPVEHHPKPKEAKEGEVVKEKGDYLAVFDLDINEWRSLKPSRVTEILFDLGGE